MLCSPISNQEGEVHVIKNEVIVVWLMRVLFREKWILFLCMFGDCTKTKTFKAHEKVEFWWAVEASYLHTF